MAPQPRMLPDYGAAERNGLGHAHGRSREDIAQRVLQIAVGGARGIAGFINPPFVDQTTRSVQQKDMRRADRAEQIRDRAIFVFEVREIESFVVGAPRHLRKSIRR